MKTTSGKLRSGKGSRDENFPVASWLIKPQHRPAILAFYEFVRVADDIADHASLTSGEKVDRLNGMEASLLGKSVHEPEGVRLRGVLEAQRLTPRHAQDLLDAFRQDATKQRYTNWDESDRLLLAVGNAGRALCARRARRIESDLAGQ